MYSIISPPFTLKFDQMTKQEMRDYYAWFMDVMPNRLKILINTVKSTSDYEVWVPDYSPESLVLLGRWFFENVQTRTRTSEEMKTLEGPIKVENWELADKTISIAMDIGMYFAQVFLKNFPNLKWKHLINVSKNHIDYGRPVIEGFGKLTLNPIHLMLVLAYGFADKTKTPDRLKELFGIWKGYIK